MHFIIWIMIQIVTNISMSSHNKQYDDDAFLGENKVNPYEGKSYYELPLEEGKRRLGLIVQRIDEDKDGFITMPELQRFVKRHYVEEHVGRFWKSLNPYGRKAVTWEAYFDKTFKDIVITENQIKYDENNMPSCRTTDNVTYNRFLNRERRSWGAADQDLDDKLTREELTVFLNAQDYPEMRDIVVTETFEGIDSNSDGKITMEEYIDFKHSNSELEVKEPEWVKEERERFTKSLDLNGDGYLDREEVSTWNYDHTDTDAEMLIFDADLDSDGKLTKEEILENYYLFGYSQATDYGKMLERHDEF